MSRLGPLVADRDGCRLDAAAGRGCRFSPDGVELVTPGGSAGLRWGDVHHLSVGAPPRWRRLRAAPAVLVALAAQDVSSPTIRGRTVTVRVGDRRRAGPEVDLGLPAGAPYRARDLDALDVLLDLLGERRWLPVLGDPRAAATLLDAAAGAARSRVPRLARRVRAAVVPHLTP